ncbi:MAG TPA: hypothetical protein PK926_06155 [Spirochaetota bacterium]|nr:hypothetical protein [Spirochaetota bacterium]HPI89070.1 hypothetical protein [Spirochaetota bacterium]HPR48719.1 hypothetical protein [Spirochaetota bacterium]
MSFKNWPKRKIDTLIRIYPYYSDQKLSEIVGCSVEEINEFRRSFPRINKELLKKASRKNSDSRIKKHLQLNDSKNNHFYIKNEGSDFYLYCNEEVLFRTCSEERMKKYLKEKNIQINHS